MIPRLIIVLVAAVALLSGLYLSARHYSSPVSPGMPDSTASLVGQQRPDFKLGSSTGKFVSPADFPGKTLLINFWATWCTPCLEEMPMLVELQGEYGETGLQVIGIAMDDVQSARDFIQKYGISYPVLVGEADVMQTNHDYGNNSGMLPYSVLVDRDGVVRWQYSGAVQRDELLGLLGDLL